MSEITDKLNDMSINEIAQVFEKLYKDFDEIQGYIDLAKKQALDAMKMMETSVI